MSCAHPGCSAPARESIGRTGPPPRYCLEHTSWYWKDWRMRERRLQRLPSERRVFEMAPLRAHDAIVADLRSQLAVIFAKWERVLRP